MRSCDTFSNIFADSTSKNTEPGFTTGLSFRNHRAKLLLVRLPRLIVLITVLTALTGLLILLLLAGLLPALLLATLSLL